MDEEALEAEGCMRQHTRQRTRRTRWVSQLHSHWGDRWASTKIREPFGAGQERIPEEAPFVFDGADEVAGRGGGHGDEAETGGWWGGDRGGGGGGRHRQ